MTGAYGGALDLGPWCTKCGRPASFLAGSIDPAHPIGRCRRNDPDGPDCGRVILTWSTIERDAVFDRLRARLQTGRHTQHVRTGHPEPYCETCQTAASSAASHSGTETAGVWSTEVATTEGGQS